MSEKIHQEIYTRLKEAARSGELITYGQIAPLANLNLQSQADRNKIGEILGQISTHEHENGRPLLSAIVVLSGDGCPSEGFFKLARHLGRYSGHSDEEDLAFFAREIKHLYSFWQDEQ